MRQFLCAAVLALCAAPVTAQQDPALEEELLDFFGDLATPLLPLVDDLLGQIGDLSSYHAPEFLPNGDILIRKRQPDLPFDAPLPDQNPVPLHESDEMVDL